MLDEATYLKSTVMFGSKTIQVQNPLLTSVPLNWRRERLTNTSMAASGARDVESTEVVSNKTDTIVVDQRSARTGTTDSEMSIADVVDEDCDLDASTVTNTRMQRGSRYSEKGLGGVAPFIERNLGNVAPTLDWRGRVLHSQEATQATSSRQQHTAEERIRQHYQKQEMILEGEIVKHVQRYELAIKQLEEWEKDEEDYPVPEWWEVQSDYQPTECGDDGGRYHMPEREFKQQALGQPLQSLKGQDIPSVSPPAAKNTSFVGSQIMQEHKRPQKKRAARH
ncbi:hypothetical protein F5888DRAFT_1738804 [Russula emetica]|nr:hypothetical protein F5888DRAFT_1747086 [Russula emetica]KAF8490925.1 hypothetical protein F5888DRAFT_1738804 [Russula emetica]